jgi:hypothetical protein
MPACPRWMWCLARTQTVRPAQPPACRAAAVQGEEQVAAGCPSTLKTLFPASACRHRLPFTASSLLALPPVSPLSAVCVAHSTHQ